MSTPGVTGAAMVVGAAAGAFLGAALLTSPVAYGDELPALPQPPFPYDAFILPGAARDLPTNVETFDIPFLYHGLQQDEHYEIADGGSYFTTHVEHDFGGFPAMQGPDNNIFDPLPFYHYVSDTVYDSSGAAPVDGVVWTTTGAGIPICSGGLGLCLSEFGYLNYNLTTPDGTIDLTHFVLFGGAVNEYYYGPAGIFDEIVFTNGNSIPIIDIPFEDSSTAAVADFFNAGDLGGLGDLLSAGDLADAGEASTLWADLLAML